MTTDVRQVQGRLFDRVPEASQNADYPVGEALEQVELVRDRVLWTPPPTLDQGPDGACVGFGWTHELLTTPVAVDLREVHLPAARWPVQPVRFAKRLYFACQRNDEWDGGAYRDAEVVYSGTSVVAGARMLRRLGFMPEYRWAESVDDVRRSVLAFGPVVGGFNWLESMFDAPGGVLTVAGAVAGGHCVMVNGYDPDRGFAITNSWGPGWGDNGTAWVSDAGFAALFEDRGEVCVPVRRSYGPRR